jgi:hypothetical protein
MFDGSEPIEKKRNSDGKLTLGLAGFVSLTIEIFILL